MHYNEDRQFEPDADLMKAVGRLTEGWSGVDLYAAMNLIGGRLADAEHPQFEPCEEELTDERHVGTTGIAHRLTCPHCGDMIDEVEEVDWSVGVNRAYIDPLDGEAVVNTGWGDRETLGFRCPTCKGFADLPTSTEIRWN